MTKRENCFYFWTDAKQNTERMVWIDFMKGVAMLLVIITHTLPLASPLRSVISNMHNSSFYLVSGILFASTGDKLKNKELDGGVVIKKKAARCMYPFFIWLTIYSLLEVGMLYVFGHENISIRDSVLNAANKLWFLPVLFIAFFLCCLLWRCIVDDRLVVVVWSGLVFVVGIYSSAISKILFFSFLVWIGIRCYNLLITRKMTLLLGGLYAVICFFAFFFRGGGYYRNRMPYHRDTG